jgi:uncharacterized membrane protein
LTNRLAPIDRLRGLVMVLMTSDHAAHVFYRDSIMRDTAMMPGWEAPLPAVPFLHRWLSHLCAPSFVFLAGAALALSIARKRALPAWAIDRDLLLRGLLLIGLDLTLVSMIWGGQMGGAFILQVLFAIGSSMLVMIPLRRLPSPVIFALGLVLAVGFEGLIAWGMRDGADAESMARDLPSLPLPVAALVSGGFAAQRVFVIYPTLPWLAMLLLGYAYGDHVACGRRPLPPLWIGAVAGLSTWLVVRALDGYGNMRMTGVHDGVIRWLQVSKYPPSLAFVGLELGLMAAVLAMFFAASRRRDSARPPSDNGVLLVLGQTALFFYVLHIPLLEGAGFLIRALGGEPAGGLGRTWLVVACVVALLYPACRWFRAWKRSHPASLVRLI